MLPGLFEKDVCPKNKLCFFVFVFVCLFVCFFLPEIAFESYIYLDINFSIPFIYDFYLFHRSMLMQEPTHLIDQWRSNSPSM